MPRKSDETLIAEARAGRLRCTRDRNLNPTFTAGINLTAADRNRILELALYRVLVYEQYGPYGFGIGRLLAAPPSPAKATAGAR